MTVSASTHCFFVVVVVVVVFSLDKSAAALNHSANPLSLFLSAARAPSDVCHFRFTRALCQPYTDGAFSSNSLEEKRKKKRENIPPPNRKASRNLGEKKPNAG